MDVATTAAISGALAGGIFGFLSSFVIKMFEQKNEKYVLASGIIIELDKLMDSLCLSREYSHSYLGEVIRYRGPIPGMTIRMHKATELLLIKSTIGKLGLLNSGISLKIIDLVAKYEIYCNSICSINGEGPLTQAQVNKNIIIILRTIHTTQPNLMSLCDQIISDLEISKTRLVNNPFRFAWKSD